MDTLRITPRRGEHFCFKVVSQSDRETTYYVDLTQNHGNGVCSCLYYEHQAGAALHRRVATAKADAAMMDEDITEEEAHSRAFQPYKRGVRGCTECKHIAAARNHVWMRKIRPMLHSFRDGIPKDVGTVLRKFFA